MNYKNKLFFLLFFSHGLFLACHTFPSPNKNQLSWLNTNIISLLKNNGIKNTKTLSEHTPSIGFFSVDIKFDGENIKICEIGNGLYGVPLPSFSSINGKKEILYTPYWDLFWLFLKQFNLPILYIGKNTTNGAKTLRSVGGKTFKNIDAFRNVFTKNFTQSPTSVKTKKINDYSAILAYGGARNFGQINQLKKDFPNILFVNNFDALFHRQKDKIHEFFNCDELSFLRPRWTVYPHRYTATLAQIIQQDIPADYYILKPAMGRKAQGVVMIEKQHLDAALKNILQKTALNPTDNYKKEDWKKTLHQSTFIVEEYAPSKTIYHKDKPYDPTLRAVFAVYYDSGKIGWNFFSCFWKKPPYSLNENVSLTDKHITKSMIGCTEPGQEVEPKDMEKLKQIFDAIIPVMYEKMLLGMK